MNHEFKKISNKVYRITTKLRQSQCLKRVSFSDSVHIETNKKQLFNQRFLRVSDRLNLSLVRISIISY